MVKKKSKQGLFKAIGIVLLMIVGFVSYAQEQTNKATYYHDKFEKRRTSSGEVFSQKKYTAAHKTLPLNTIVKVTNKKNGKAVLVKINDRCANKGVIDLSKAAAKKIDLLQAGVATVKVEVLGKECEKIWQQQPEMFQMFEDANLSFEQQSQYLDSLIHAAGVITIDDFSFNYYVRVAIVGGKTQAEEIMKDIPEKYRLKTRSEKIYNENFYYVTIGPFATREEGNMAITELKLYFPAAHLIKKKNK